MKHSPQYHAKRLIETHSKRELKVLLQHRKRTGAWAHVDWDEVEKHLKGKK